MHPRVLLHDTVGDGDPLVLIPGGLTGWLSWLPHQERLKARYRTTRVQPIHNELGSAGEPGDPAYSREIERESLRLTLDHLGIEQASFAAWSSGGRALLEFAAVHPSRVTSMVLVEPAAYWILERVGEVGEELAEFIRYINGMAGTIVTDDDLASFLASAGFVDDPARARTHAYWERAAPHRMALSWLSEALMGSDLSVADLRSIDCPALVTKGTTTEPWEMRVVDLLGSYLPNARVVEIEGSHAHHIESIDRFLDELDAHLEGAGH